MKIVEFALGASVVVLPGALTPTEVTRAWKAGADFVKVFPCAQVGGDSYIRALKAPFPTLPLIASGGVNQHTAANFILAGAAALGIGGELIPKDAIRLRQAERIFTLAHRFVKFVSARPRPTPAKSPGLSHAFVALVFEFVAPGPTQRDRAAVGLCPLEIVCASWVFSLQKTRSACHPERSPALFLPRRRLALLRAFARMFAAVGV